VSNPGEPNEADSTVDGVSAIDLDDARFDERGSADVETGAGETGAAEGSSDTADLDTATDVADVVPEVESGDPQSLVSDPLVEPAEPEDEDPVEAMKKALRIAPGDWYVVHSYAGYENKVKTNLEARIQSLDV
jgi:transcriptional antiterminator NusG